MATKKTAPKGDYHGKYVSFWKEDDVVFLNIFCTTQSFVKTDWTKIKKELQKIV